MSDGLKRYTMRELEEETESLALEILGMINKAMTDFTKRTGVVVELNARTDGQHPAYTHDGDVCAPRQFYSWYFTNIDIKPIMPSQSRSKEKEHQEELRMGFIAEQDGKVYDSFLEEWVNPKP